MIRSGLIVAFAILGFLEGPAYAQHGILSCYSAARFDFRAPVPAIELFVLVDQTTPLDAILLGNAREIIAHMIVPGTQFAIVSFSAFSPGHYPNVEAWAYVEKPIAPSERLYLGRNKLDVFDSCMSQQVPYALTVANSTINRLVSANNGAFLNSEILASMRQISGRVAASRARRKIVIILSDMLEHSSVTTFYDSGRFKLIDPVEQYARVERAGVLGNFGGAQVYVIGGGMLSANSIRETRRTPELDALERFWSRWFRRSNAHLVEFGRPALMRPVR